LPERIGSYHLRRVIAVGGMGTVYEATQDKPRRVVALKLLRQGVASRSTLRRFDYESQILARLRHPAIAQIYEAGTHRDEHGTVPYFAMEYVVGAKSITRYASEAHLKMRERLELFAKVCDAVHHGHQKGIIHRDLKPSNILVDASGQVKLIDFGVARATDSDLAVTTLQTDIGQLIGTLQYMSPEQCEADPHNIDTRSDVYALGVVLYELLCERLPYDLTHVAMYEATRIIREQKPMRLTIVDRTLRGDVETIALKALEKQRERRYESASALASDIRHYLKSEPITARPPSMAYQARIFARNNKALVAGVLMVLVTLTAGIIGTTAGMIRARDAEARATAIADFLVNDMMTSVTPEFAQGRKITVEEVVDKAVARLDSAFSNQPDLEASIRGTMGRIYRSLGLYDAAQKQLRAAEATQARDLGDSHEVTLRTRSELVEVLQRRGEYAAAEDLGQRTLEAQRHLLGDRHPDVIATICHLASVCFSQGEYLEAEALFREALALQREVLGTDHPNTAATMYGLADVLVRLKEWKEAEALYRESLAVRRRVLGDRHPDTLMSMGRLAVVLKRAGRLDEAEAMYGETLDLQRRVLGEEHPVTLHTMVDLGRLITGQKRYADAEAFYQKAVELRRRSLGASHPDTLIAMNGLAEALRGEGKMDEARAVTREVIAHLKSRTDGPNATPMYLNDYAWLLLTCEPPDLRDPEAALAAAEKAVALTNESNFMLLDTLAKAYYDNGDATTAASTQRKAIALLSDDQPELRRELERTLSTYVTNAGGQAPQN